HLQALSRDGVERAVDLPVSRDRRGALLDSRPWPARARPADAATAARPASAPPRPPPRGLSPHRKVGRRDRFAHLHEGPGPASGGGVPLPGPPSDRTAGPACPRTASPQSLATRPQGDQYPPLLCPLLLVGGARKGRGGATSLVHRPGRRHLPWRSQAR